MKLILWKESILIGLIVLILHIFALKFYLYWTVLWFDIPMHFLGGFLIGLIVISIIKRVQLAVQKSDEILNKWLLFISVILAVLVVGLTWELWELFVGFTDVLSDKADTVMDVVMDLIGGFAAILYYYFKYLEL
jgi:hypothetical protein